MVDLVVRAAIVQAFAHARRMSAERACATIAQRYPSYSDELTKFICRAASSPATTFEEGWAAEFVVAMGADLIVALMPRSVFAQLAAQGMHLTFGNADIMVPDFIPSAVGTFIRQGEPIPVIQGTTIAQFLTRKKLACIVSYSGDVDEGTIVPLEGILRTRIRETAIATLDSILLDDQPGTDVRPAGLLNGAVQVTSTGVMHADLQLLAQELSTIAGHYIRVPVLIMNIAQDLAAHRNFGEVMPLISSPSVAPGTIIMVDAADFACAGGQVPRFEISKEAALHFEDSNPEHLHVGSPVRSLWQEETLGLRMILEVDWCLRRPGIAAYMRNVHWH